MFFKNLCILVLWTKVASALGGLNPTGTTILGQVFLKTLFYYQDTIFVQISGCMSSKLGKKLLEGSEGQKIMSSRLPLPTIFRNKEGCAITLSVSTYSDEYGNNKCVRPCVRSRCKWIIITNLILLLY